MTGQKRLLLVVAINEEFKIIKKYLKTEKKKKTGKKEFPFLSGTIEDFQVDLVMSSMGMEHSLKCAEKTIDPEIYGGVFIVGYCGGLSLTLSNSDVVIPTQVISSKDGQVFQMDNETTKALGKIVIGEGHKYRAVPMVTEPLVIESPDEKLKLFKKTGAEAVDMETSEIVRIAQARKIPISALKIVIDDVETELPHFNDIFKKTGRMDQLSVTSALMAQPALSMQLSRHMKMAAVVLGDLVPKIILKLGTRWGIEKKSV